MQESIQRNHSAQFVTTQKYSGKIPCYWTERNNTSGSAGTDAPHQVKNHFDRLLRVHVGLLRLHIDICVSAFVEKALHCLCSCMECIVSRSMRFVFLQNISIYISWMSFLGMYQRNRHTIASYSSRHTTFTHIQHTCSTDRLNLEEVKWKMENEKRKLNPLILVSNTMRLSSNLYVFNSRNTLYPKFLD